MGRFAIMLILGLLPLLPSCHSIRDDFHKRSGSKAPRLSKLPRLELGSLLQAGQVSTTSELQALKQTRDSGISPNGSFLTPTQVDALTLRLAVLQSRLGLTQESSSTLWKLRQTTKDPWTRSLAQALQAWSLLEAGQGKKAAFVLSKIPPVEKARLEPLISQMRRRIQLASPAPAQPSKVVASHPGLSFFPRRSWGNRRAIPRKMEPMGKPTRITIHHTAMDAPLRPADSPTQIRLIQRNQIQQNHWGDIGYHFLIDPWGRIFEGRKLQFQGAHAGDGRTNKHNIGICLLGNFQAGQQGATHPTSAQIQAMRNLVRVLSDTFDIPSSQVFSHREIRPTATSCPGTYLIPEIQRLKKDLAVHRSLRRKKRERKSLGSRLGG